MRRTVFSVIAGSGLLGLCAAALQRDAMPVPPAQLAAFDPNAITAFRCSDRNAAGVGLKGDYFSTDEPVGRPLLSRVDPTVAFDASLEWPAHLAGQRPRVARWQGWVKAPLTGRYTFHGEPSARIVVAGLAMAGGAAPADASIDMVAGRFYPIEMQVDLRVAAPVRLEWTAPHGMRYVIPRALLFLPTTA